MSSFFARASASSPHGYQSTGLSLCCCRYGEVSPASRLDIGYANGESVGDYPSQMRDGSTAEAVGLLRGRCGDMAGTKQVGAPVLDATAPRLPKRGVGGIRLAHRKNSRGSSFTMPDSSVRTIR